MPKLTGPDYLLGIADKLAKDGIPFADDFKDMVFACFSGPALLPTAAVAQRPLTPQEQAPVAVVGTAMEMALQDRDMKSLEEVMTVGMSLAIKFAEYLDTRSPGAP